MNDAERPMPSLFTVPLVLVFVGLFLFIALLQGQRELTVLCVALLGIAAAARLWTHWSLKAVSCGMDLDRRRLFPGERLVLKARAENRKILPVRLEVRAPVGGLRHVGDAAREVRAESGLLWYQKAEFRWDLAAGPRGVHTVGPLAMETGDLFGFFPKERRTAETAEVVVYPRIVPIGPIALPRRDLFGVPGAASPVDDPVYILGTRDYQEGRPAKYIHWKATARHHRLQEKVFEPSSQEKILLVVDVGGFARRGQGEPFERMLEKVASAAVQLAGRGCAVGLATNGRMVGEGLSIVPVTRNPHQLKVLFESLARLTMAPARDLIETFRLQLRIPWGVSCLYFGLEEDETAGQAREYFRQRRVPFRFQGGAAPARPGEAPDGDQPAAVAGTDGRSGGEEGDGRPGEGDRHG